MMELNKIYNMDCLEGMKKLPDDSIDLIVTDPPYFLPAKHYQSRRYFTRNFSDISILEHFFKSVFSEFRRVTKKTATIYVFCDGQSYPIFYYHLYPICKGVRPLVWDKGGIKLGHTWRHQFELIIFAERPKAKHVVTGEGDILRYPTVKVDNRLHPAQKPMELTKALIAKSSLKEATILDPFMGSGTTAIACMELGKKYVGFEMGKEYCKIAEKRLAEWKEQTRLG